jgi:hypothetical protein
MGLRFSDLSKNLITLIFLCIVILFSCGLPVYKVLEPPVYYGSSNYAVGFRTPDDPIIDGYVIYYKIYNTGENLIREDEKLFDPDYYQNTAGTELPFGESLPRDLNFYQLGILGNNVVSYPQIPWSESGDILQIDFTGALNQESDPVFTMNGLVMTDSIAVPARYTRYTSGTLSGTFKSFINNYSYSNDVDILDVKNRTGAILQNIEIAFVAISYGISSTTLQPMMSVPVHLGTILQQNMSDAIY